MPASGTKKVKVAIVTDGSLDRAVERLLTEARGVGMSELRSVKLEDEYWRVADGVRVFVWSAVAS